MERLCHRCVYHLSGHCSRWTCEGTTTVKDLERKTELRVLDEFLDMARDGVDLNHIVEVMNEKRKEIGGEVDATQK